MRHTGSFVAFWNKTKKMSLEHKANNRYPNSIKLFAYLEGMNIMDIVTNRVLIETVVRKALRDIKETPERSTRNLVDMALNFCEDRFHSNFFESAQTMLRDQRSHYYGLIQDIVTHVSAERLIKFGINLGYQSCTVGAELIRTTEIVEGFNIPWSVSLTLSGNDYKTNAVGYHKAIHQGQELGVYAWMLYCLHSPQSLFELIAAFQTHAFVLYCSPSDLSEEVLDDVEALHNLMFVVRVGSGVEKVCQRLRERQILYSICYTYSEPDVKHILNGDLLSDAELLHPAFTVFLMQPNCRPNIQAAVYQYVVRERNEQAYQTLPWDAVFDSYYIDNIISGASCNIGFEPDGSLSVFQNGRVTADYNLFKQPLRDILQLIFPKTLQTGI